MKDVTQPHLWGPHHTFLFFLFRCRGHLIDSEIFFHSLSFFFFDLFCCAAAARFVRHHPPTTIIINLSGGAGCPSCGILCEGLLHAMTVA